MVIFSHLLNKSLVAFSKQRAYTKDMFEEFKSSNYNKGHHEEQR